MKKYYLFAALATAGLFAGCSSDEDFSEVSDARQAIVVDDNAPAKIIINVGNPGITRGTGTVGGTTTEANHWAGQTFNLFMFKKGGFDLAKYKPTEAAAEVAIFDNTKMTTPETGENAATYTLDDGTVNFSYFPANDAYSFWAYRADDAFDDTDADGKADIDSVTTDTRVVVPVTINGSQDLMIGIADEAAATTAVKAAAPSLTDAEAEAKVYSAYAARRGVNPKLNFKHLLTRLYFQVKANTRDVSEAATLKTTDPNEEPGFKVTDITVWSKDKGEIVAAYKATDADAADFTATPASRMIWTDATQDWADKTTLTELHLMSRDKGLAEKAQYGFLERSLGAADYTLPATYEFVAGEGLKPVFNGGTVVAMDATTVVYTSTSVDAEGLPVATAANKTTVGALLAAGNPATTKVQIAFYRDGDHGDAAHTTWDEPTYEEKSNKDLLPLVPTTPKWSGYVPATTPTAYTWTEKTPAPSKYIWEINSTHVLDGTETVFATAPDESTVGALNEIGAYDDGGVTVFYELTSIVMDTDGKPEVAEDPTAAPGRSGKVGDIVKYTGDNKYYELTAYVGGADEVEGSAVATPVGEALLVAPADENGYKVRINYTRTKKISVDHVEPMTGFADIDVIRKDAAKDPIAFEAGKSYKVTIVLYSDGEINFDDEGIKPEPWGDGDGLDDEYSAE